MQLSRSVVDQKRECVMDRGVVDDMEVVQHQDNIICKRIEFVDDWTEDRSQWRRLGRAKPCQRTLAETGRRPAEREEEMSSKPDRIIVIRVERDPGERCLRCG